MDNKSLDAIRKLVSRKYIGKVGIHGIGVRRKSNAICVYLSSNSNPEQKLVLEDIEREVVPYEVLRIEEDQPIIL